MMEVDRLAALHRLGDNSITELRKCVIIVAGLCADFEMECRILENSPAGLKVAVNTIVPRSPFFAFCTPKYRLL